MPFVVFTGGEPLLQLDEPLLKAIKALGFQTAVETNGTLPIPRGLDWVCVSPKAGAILTQEHGDELKLVFPQFGLDPENFISLEFKHFFLQPMAGVNEVQNRELAVTYCLQHPNWRLSLQMHKILGLS
jgi:organic radical activating enzyme